MILQNIINKSIFPEVNVAIVTILIMLLQLFLSDKFKIIIYLFSQVGLLITILFIGQNFNFNENQFRDLNIPLNKYGFILTPEINFFKLIIVSLTFVIFVYIRNYLQTINSKNYLEYFALNLISMLGSMLLVSINNFFNLYFAIELAFLPAYILLIIEQHNLNLETIIKYIILNAIFSGLFLYGLSLIYGASGSLTFKVIADFVNDQHISGLFNVGISLVLIGTLFKLHIFPFQLWLPDVYELSSKPVIMLIASLPKIALISTLGYLFKDILSSYINLYWKNILLITGISSIFIGNFAAIVQNDIKRILAYSAIANGGFIILSLLNNNVDGLLTANFNAISYAFVIMNIFGCLIILNDKKIKNIEDFIGLSTEHPCLSLILLILLLSIVGIPPTIGFYAKFLVINSLIKIDLIWVAVVITLLSGINVIFYLQIIKNIYFFNQEHQHVNMVSNVKQNKLNMNFLLNNFNKQTFRSVDNKYNIVSVALLIINSLLILFGIFFKVLKI